MLSRMRMFALGVGGEEDGSEEASATDAPLIPGAGPRPGSIMSKLSGRNAMPLAMLLLRPPLLDDTYGVVTA